MGSHIQGPDQVGFSCGGFEHIPIIPHESIGGDRNMSKVWFITGAGRGMGVDIAQAALAAGHTVVATGRNTDRVAAALGKSVNLLIVKLDITQPAEAESAAKAAVDNFGRIDVLVNNAANFYAGFFEELAPEQMDRQLSTSLVGPMNVTRAVLPVMRKQRSGLIITISSTAGLIGFEFGTAYAASKFGLEGWMQSLQAEIEPFGIDTITVNPGFFRTELLTEESTNFAERTIEDYNERRAKQMEFWKGYNGQQSGDPAKLARALITISSLEKPPRRFIAGADAVGTAEQVAATLQQQTDAYRELSSSLAFDNA
jgi:NAD(P)-dependent dehydrogenase (short-subunit alcohol dehydrogenase family)